eukprot:TRINITY_DN26624_c0_g1_i1.p1 TRINITY_DN26624_c0_g1~~TRINITY_DN26624_c0_g1_i1.p1  ORF type:complete len:222 (-),score=27.25 TRINITY_DN26624_c0_g1_i1:66-731(-)
MLRFERCHAGSLIEVVHLPPAAANEAEDALRVGGFVPCGECLSEEPDDEDASPYPPPFAATAVGGGGRSATWLAAPSSIPMKLWCAEDGSGVGFDCRFEVAKRVLYAKLTRQAVVGERCLKGALKSLLDVAEASAARKITIGLGPDIAAQPDYICSFLYVGFQVTHPRKSPLTDVALMLDFFTGLPAGGLASSSDQGFTGTSECSTSAEGTGQNGDYFDSE